MRLPESGSKNTALERSKASSIDSPAAQACSGLTRQHTVSPLMRTNSSVSGPVGSTSSIRNLRAVLCTVPESEICSGRGSSYQRLSDPGLQCFAGHTQGQDERPVRSLQLQADAAGIVHRLCLDEIHPKASRPITRAPAVSVRWTSTTALPSRFCAHHRPPRSASSSGRSQRRGRSGCG